jgi:hypothetical protein
MMRAPAGEQTALFRKYLLLFGEVTIMIFLPDEE